MKSRRGFTVLELMVAIVITSVLVLLVYTTARAGLDTNERLDRYRDTSESGIVVRALLLDALRHLPEGGGAAMNDVLFSVEDGADSDGLPSDVVRFVTLGVDPPLGSTGAWSVTVSPAADGVHLSAVPMEANGAAPIEVTLVGARGFSARVLERTADLTWMDAWDAPGRVPAAVALEFLSAPGIAASPPVVVHTALELVR